MIYDITIFISSMIIIIIIHTIYKNLRKNIQNLIIDKNQIKRDENEMESPLIFSIFKFFIPIFPIFQFIIIFRYFNFLLLCSNIFIYISQYLKFPSLFNIPIFFIINFRYFITLYYLSFLLSINLQHPTLTKDNAFPTFWSVFNFSKQSLG